MKTQGDFLANGPYALACVVLGAEAAGSACSGGGRRQSALVALGVVASGRGRPPSVIASSRRLAK
jgi:hypothetical protein